MLIHLFQQILCGLEFFQTNIMASGSGLLIRTGRGTGTRNEAHNMVESGKEPVEVDELGKPW
jgi:hypothetical protein